MPVIEARTAINGGLVLDLAATTADFGAVKAERNSRPADQGLKVPAEAAPEAGGVLHCFDDGVEAVERAAALGFKLGLGGCLTYGHAALDEAVRGAPAEMLVLETDAPYLEPEPRSLRRNEPALLARVRARLCELRGWSEEEADLVTTANARELFRFPTGDPPAGLSRT